MAQNNRVTMSIIPANSIEHMTKPYSQACHNNQQPILSVLEKEFSEVSQVLEIGSGTGQHAVYFAQHLPHVNWQTSDLVINHQGITQWITDAALSNVMPPVVLDLNQAWPLAHTSAIFTANTLHIVSWSLVTAFFNGVAQHLSDHGKLCIYGPFNYNGQFTSASNRDFNDWLQARDPASGIRHIEDISQLATDAGLTLTNDHAMPANNRLLTFVKHPQ